MGSKNFRDKIVIVDFWVIRRSRMRLYTTNGRHYKFPISTTTSSFKHLLQTFKYGSHIKLCLHGSHIVKINGILIDDIQIT